MPVGHQNHHGIPVAVAVAHGGLHQSLHLGLGQVFAGPQIAVTAPFGRNCSFYGFNIAAQFSFESIAVPPTVSARAAHFTYRETPPVLPRLNDTRSDIPEMSP